MDKRLIPYSVHLPEEIYRKIKDAAGDRKASGLVREAIIAYVEKEDLHKSGFNAGLSAAMKKISSHKLASTIAINNEVISDALCGELNKLMK